MPETTVTVDDAKVAIAVIFNKTAAPKEVKDFVAGKTSRCSDASCTYGKDGGWSKITDGTLLHEVDKVIAEKYNICKEARPDLSKPYGDSFYFDTNGTSGTLLTHLEALELLKKNPSEIPK